MPNTETSDTRTDEQCMEILSDLLANRVQLGVGYLQEAEPGLLTHSVLTLRCGDLYMQTLPTELPYYFTAVTPDTSARVVN